MMQLQLQLGVLGEGGVRGGGGAARHVFPLWEHFSPIPQNVSLNLFLFSLKETLKNLSVCGTYFYKDLQFITTTFHQPTPLTRIFTGIILYWSNPNGKPRQVQRIALVMFQEAKPKNLLAF